MRSKLIHSLALVASFSTNCAIADSVEEHAKLASFFQQHPLVGKLYDQQSKEMIEEEALKEILNKTSYILIGEKHDNPAHHAIEAWLLTQLAERPTTLVLEMLNAPFSLSPQPNLPMSTEKELKSRLQWAEKSWPWEDYKQVISTATQHGFEIAGGNLKKETLMGYYQGALSLMPESQEILQSLQTPLTEVIREAHCGKLPESQLTPMAVVQVARDQQMSETLLVSNKEQKVLIAGSYHVKKDSGVPLHFKKRGLNAPLVILLEEVEQDKITPRSYESVFNHQADLIIFTAKTESRDYCADI